MSYLSSLLMAIAGLGMAANGVRCKRKWETAAGCCFLGVAVFGYVSRYNDMYSWVQVSFAIASVAFLLIGVITRRKAA